MLAEQRVKWAAEFEQQQQMQEDALREVGIWEALESNLGREIKRPSVVTREVLGKHITYANYRENALRLGFANMAGKGHWGWGLFISDPILLGDGNWDSDAVNIKGHQRSIGERQGRDFPVNRSFTLDYAISQKRLKLEAVDTKSLEGDALTKVAVAEAIAQAFTNPIEKCPLYDTMVRLDGSLRGLDPEKFNRRCY